MPLSTTLRAPIVAAHDPLFAGTPRVPRPAVDIDFERMPSLNYAPGVEIDWSRASTQSYFDVDGMLRFASADTPAFTYDPATGQPLGVQIFEGKTEMLEASEDFSNSAWQFNYSTGSIIPNDEIAPDGTSGADLADSNGGDTFNIYQEVSLLPETTYILSVWVKPKVIRTHFVLSVYDDIAGNVHSDQKVGELVSGNWVRVSTVFTMPSSIDTTSVIMVARDTDCDLWFWGANLHTGSVLKPYNPSRGSLAQSPTGLGSGLWNFKLNSTVATDVAVAPDGTATADEVVHTDTNATFGQSLAITADTHHVISIFAKYKDVPWVRLNWHNNAGSSAARWFNIQTGEKGTVAEDGTATLLSSGITDVGNGWYLLHIVAINAAGATTGYVSINNQAGDGNVSEAVGGGNYFWGVFIAEGTAVDLTEVMAPSLITAPFDFSDAAWEISNDADVAVTADYRIAPDGTTTGDHVDNTAAESIHGLYQDVDTGSQIAGKTFVFSVYVYTDDGRDVTLRVRATGSPQEAENFTVSTVANQWTKVSAVKSFTSASGNIVRCAIYPAELGVATGVADFWGASLHLATGLNYYSSGNTQSDDVAISDLDWLVQGRGTLLVDAELAPDDDSATPRFIALSTSMNTDRILVAQAANNKLDSRIYNSGVLQVDDHSLTLTSGTNRMALAWQDNDVGWCVNGGTVSKDTLATIPTNLTTAYLGSSETGAGYINSNISRIAYWPYRLTDGELPIATAKPPFGVTDVPGVVLWLRAHGSPVTLDGTNVTQWNDISGAGNHLTQLSGANQPSYMAGAINGRAGIVFNGSADFMSAGSGASLDASTDKNVLVVVACDLISPDQSFEALVSKANPGGGMTAGFQFLARVSGSETWGAQIGAGVNFTVAEALSGLNILTMLLDRSENSIILRRNGIEKLNSIDASVGTDFDVADDLLVGADRGPSRFIGGIFGDVIVVLGNGATEENAIKIEQQLSQIYGISIS